MEKAQDPVSSFQADVSPVFLVLVGFLKEQDAHDHAEDYHASADQIRKKIGVFVEYRSRLKISRIVSDRIGEGTT